MKMGTGLAVLALLAGVASAAPIRVEESAVGGGQFILNPGDLSSTVFGMGNNPPNFAGGPLMSVHQALQANGVNTDDIITILAANTNDGLSLFALLDKQVGGFIGNNSRLDLTAVAHDGAGNGINGWVNDNAGELIQLSTFNPISNTYAANVTYQWDNRSEGDAYAWSNLGVGDDGTFVFNPLQGFGLTGISRGFQYVSFNNNAWTVVGTGNFNNAGAGGSSTSLDWRVIPLPSAGAMSLAGLALVGSRRRRAL